MQIAIITGASSGLGKVFFEKIVERYPQLDEYWVIARRENKLKELAEQHPQQKVRVVPLDLSGTGHWRGAVLAHRQWLPIGQCDGADGLLA